MNDTLGKFYGAAQLQHVYTGKKKEKMLSIEACHSIRESCKIFVRQNNCPDSVQLLYRGINSPDQTPAISVECILNKNIWGHSFHICSAILDAFEVIGRQFLPIPNET